MATHPAIGLKGEQEFGTQKRSHGHSFVRLLSVGNQPQLRICKELHHKEGRTMFTVVVDNLRSFKVPANSMFREIKILIIAWIQFIVYLPGTPLVSA